MGRWVIHLIVLSQEPETIVLPSELMVTLDTGSECPCSFVFSLSVSASQILQGGYSSMISTWILAARSLFNDFHMASHVEV